MTALESENRTWLRRYLAGLMAAMAVSLTLVAAFTGFHFGGRGSPGIQQGVYGLITLYEGDCMPIVQEGACRISHPSRLNLPSLAPHLHPVPRI